MSSHQIDTFYEEIIVVEQIRACKLILVRLKALREGGVFGLLLRLLGEQETGTTSLLLADP